MCSLPKQLLLAVCLLLVAVPALAQDVEIVPMEVLTLTMSASDQSELDQFNVPVVGMNASAHIGGACYYSAQTFTVGVTGTLTAVSVAVGRYGAHTFNLRVAIRDTVNNHPGDNELAVAILPPNEQANSWATFFNKKISFATGIPVVAGTRLAIVVNYEGGGGGMIEGRWYGEYPAMYPGGSPWAGKPCYNMPWPWVESSFIDKFFRTYVSTVLDVTIDIKPGSDPNSINLGSAGVIPVAILSSADFDAPNLVDPDSLRLAGASVNLIGKSAKYQCSSQDVNGDGLVDYVCHFETQTLSLLEPGDTTAVLEGKTWAGRNIRGTDAVQIVP